VASFEIGDVSDQPLTSVSPAKSRQIRSRLAAGYSPGTVVVLYARGRQAFNGLATYCLHGAAAGLPSKAAVGRLVAVTLAGLRPGG
jgi:hypothetical protein